MKRMVSIKLFLVMLGVVILMTSAVSAKDFTLGGANSSFIEKNYLEGEYVRGKINISFNDQRNDMFTSNFVGGISLVDLLKNMSYVSGTDYQCDPDNCEKGYSSAATGESEIETSLDSEDGQLYGLVIRDDEDVEQILDGFKFDVDLSANPSCTSQMYIDLFDDDSVDFYNQNMKPLDNEGGICSDEEPYNKNFGCFDEDEIEGVAKIGKSAYYCQIIKDLPAAPAYRIGANVDKTGGDDTLKFSLYKYPYTGGQALGTVDLINPGSGDASVIINYSSPEEFDALVCVVATNGANYNINYAEVSRPCGGQLSLQGLNGNFTRAFDMYARAMGFGALSDFTFDSETYKKITKRELKTDLNNYFDAKYGGNCSEGCVIPFKVWGDDDLYARFHSAEINYKTSDLEQPGDGLLYELDEEKARVTTSKYLLLDIEKMKFEVPSTGGSKNFALKLGNEQVYSSSLNVNIGFDFSMAPRFALLGRETEFVASGASGVTSSTWDFGDGSALVYSIGEKAKHTYAQAGTYDIRVTLVKQPLGATATNSSKKFTVVVGEPKTSANLTLLDLESRINSLKTQTAHLSNSWLGENIKTVLKLTEAEAEVKKQRDEFDSKAEAANTKDEDYIPIINALAALDIPKSIYVSEQGQLPGEVGFGNINVNHLEKISDKEIQDNNAAAGGIIDWMTKNYGLTIDYQTVSALDGDDSAPLMKWYKISVNPKSGRDTTYAYLVVDYPMSSMILKDSSGFTEIPGGTYKGFEGSAPLTSMEFIISGSTAPDPQQLGAYISPALSDLGIVDGPIRESWYEDQQGHFNWGRFLIGIALLLAGTLFVYIILQSWYKRYYEKRLFKNPADLYNLINFVYNSRRSEIKDSVIKEKLGEKKWSHEQITYVFNKLEGKRTGMWEIPLFKFFEKNKVKKELEKKQKEKVDRRFIKQPGV